jgi:hypothetical protein
MLRGVVGKRLSNSELHLKRLEEAEAAERDEKPKGIFELFPPDEDAPLTRDGDAADGDDASSSS